jgi:hypothetical protein
MRLGDELLRLAERGDENSTDDDCIAFFGILRDCGYQIQKQAGQELENHRLRDA